MKTGTFMTDLNEIHEIYNELCLSEPDSLSGDEFEEFLRFLEIDYYDWVRGNLKQFIVNKD